MNAAKYRDILDENLFQSALDLRLGGRFTFQQDNGPKHTAKITKEWLQNNTVTILKDGNKGKDWFPVPGAKLGNRPDIFDDPSYVNVQNLDKSRQSARGATNGQRDIFDMKPFEDAIPPSVSFVTMEEQLKRELWYHGNMTRKDAERQLKVNGDFLVRESTTTPGQYVLTGLQNGQPKHLLLVDPEGVVRTKDHRFESVSHLISYHMDNHLPIISAGSELCLQQPVERRP
ncbi:unnamed protein product [Ranitomeya imitator]|uniref:SH2 domain-containing protein n=1 Tax=Ranitomeya imitator TaxID=111125 RepID=A0ABN9M6P2_9NEOB|nr:unnamed protein product [Ranitomeya imitator]